MISLTFYFSCAYEFAARFSCLRSAYQLQEKLNEIDKQIHPPLKYSISYLQYKQSIFCVDTAAI